MKNIKENRKTYIRNLIKRKRILKTITWRSLSTLTTFLVAYVVTGSVKYGGYIALIEVAIKSIEYWYHEHIWDKYTRKKIKQIKLRESEVTIYNIDKESVHKN
jgi:uncharacterized membrane protein